MSYRSKEASLLFITKDCCLIKEITHIGNVSSMLIVIRVYSMKPPCTLIILVPLLENNKCEYPCFHTFRHLLWIEVCDKIDKPLDR